MKNDIDVIPVLWAEAIRRNLYKPSPFPFMWRRRTWKERLLSWPWRPWKKLTIVTKPPREAERGDRVEIRNLSDIRIAHVPGEGTAKIFEMVRKGPAYACPEHLTYPQDEVKWTPSGRGATIRYRKQGWKKPEPVGPTEIQCDLGNESEENRWLDKL